MTTPTSTTVPMTYPADFTGAHRRHWQDAELLFAKRRWANADQLYGFSAECGLKAILEKDGERIEGDYKKHIHKLWPEFKNFADGRKGKRYLSRLPDGEPFSDWSHHNRYAASLHFNEAKARPHRAAAEGIYRMVLDAELDGGR